MRNIRRRIEELGGEYRFECMLEGLDMDDGRVRGVQTSSGLIPTGVVILGIGHSARDTYQMLFESGVPFEPKAFQLGLRIEQPQEQINQQKYGKPEYESILGAADYTLTAKAQRDVYSFCMCAGGLVIPSVSESGHFCTNGMSNSRHDSEFGNSGLMVTLQPGEFGSDHPPVSNCSGSLKRRRSNWVAETTTHRFRRRPHSCSNRLRRQTSDCHHPTYEARCPPTCGAYCRSLSLRQYGMVCR